jgi:RNA polymerase sigma factor (sigma-70 family)
MSCASTDNTTSPSLLARVGDWQDLDAWAGFVRRYEPTIRLYCRRFALDPETLEELVQQIWVELARRLKTYSYDPGKTFRGWLMHVCRSRAIDLIRKKRLDARILTLELTREPAFDPREDPPATEDDRPDFIRLAEGVQDVVRARVDARTWTTFWSIVVEGRPVRETADAQGLTYAAAFAAQKRVRRMLREEGRRALGASEGKLAGAHSLAGEGRA